MLKARWLQNIHQYILCILAFSIPLPFLFSSISIIVLAFVWLLGLNFREFATKIKERKALWLWIGLYLLHAISYFYSADKEQSGRDLETKLSFIILPLLIGAGMDINRQLLERIFLGFVLGISAVSIFCLGQATISWQQTGDYQYFFYHELIRGLDANAVYEAWYTIFSLSILLFFPWKRFFVGKARIWKVILIAIQFAFFILLSSRMLIVVFLLFLIPYYISKAFKKFAVYKTIVILLLLAIPIIAVFSTKNPIRKRYENIAQIDISQAYMKDYSNVAEGDFSNLTLRLFLWRLGWENVQEHNLWLTGAGNGDVHKLQNDKMAEYGIRNIYPVNTWRSPFYNANLHNMYLQILLMLGFIGLLTFILITFLPLFKLKDFIYGQVFLLFHLVAIFFMLQEAALQSQAGIIYYTFFSMIFWNISYRKPKKDKLLTDN
jgi:O-antigen ligase